MRIRPEFNIDPAPKQAIPAARRSDLITQDVDGELFVYDTDRDTLHQLNRVAAAVWHLCDGRRSMQTLALLAGALLDQSLDERTVRMALTKLEGAGLLESPLPEGIRLNGMDRRRFMKRSAIGAGVLPVIVSISAPTAAAAASGCKHAGNYCTFDSECCGTCIKEYPWSVQGTCSTW